MPKKYVREVGVEEDWDGEGEQGGGKVIESVESCGNVWEFCSVESSGFGNFGFEEFVRELGSVGVGGGGNLVVAGNEVGRDDGVGIPVEEGDEEDEDLKELKAVDEEEEDEGGMPKLEDEDSEAAEEEGGDEDDEEEGEEEVEMEFKKLAAVVRGEEWWEVMEKEAEEKKEEKMKKKKAKKQRKKVERQGRPRWIGALGIRGGNTGHREIGDMGNMGTRVGITIDSAAEESVCPESWGKGEFGTLNFGKAGRLDFRAANG